MTIYKKLFELQQKIGAISKDSTASVLTKKGGTFNYKYFDINTLIEALKPHLIELQLVIVQPLIVVDGKNAIKTVIYNLEDESSLESIALLPDNIDPQEFGIGVTYFRRYCVVSLLFLPSEDNDGDIAGKNNPKIPVSQKPYAQAMPQAGRPELTCCGVPMKHLQGTSKVGKPYDFHTCDNCKKNIYPPK